MRNVMPPRVLKAALKAAPLIIYASRAGNRRARSRWPDYKTERKWKRQIRTPLRTADRQRTRAFSRAPASALMRTAPWSVRRRLGGSGAVAVARRSGRLGFLASRHDGYGPGRGDSRSARAVRHHPLLSPSGRLAQRHMACGLYLRGHQGLALRPAQGGLS